MEQHEYPGRAPLPEEVLYVRRARISLLFVGLFVGASVVLPLLGISRVFGASWIVRELGQEPPVPLLLPIGAVALPIAMLAANMIGELFGKRPARSLVRIAIVVWMGVLGLLWVTDHMPAYDNTTTNSFYVALALVGASLVMFVIQIELFAWIGARWLRHIASTSFAVAAGWGAFALAVPRLAIPGAPADAEVLGIALGAGGYTWLAVMLGTIAVIMISRALAIYLRVGLRRSVVVERDDDRSEPAFVSRKQRAFTEEEEAFFEAGDQLASEVTSARR